MSAMRHRTTTAASTLLLLCGHAMGQGYLIQALPPLPGYPDSFACGINESGVVVGTCRNGSTWRATRWLSGVPSDLGALAGSSNVVVLDVSSDGAIVVGEAKVGTDWVPVVWENGALTQIPGPALPLAGCWQINNSGVIAGRSGGATPGDAIACRWEKDAGGAWMFTPLTPLAGFAASYAWGINNAGVIAGASINTWDDSRATHWNAATPSPHPGFAGASTMTSINDLGQSVGELQVAPGGAWHAQFHDGSGPIDLGTLVYPNSYAGRINNSGTIIGQSYADGLDPTGFPSSNKLAIIWRTNGSMSAVNDLIPPGSGWDVKQLWDVNDSGAIVGYGRFNGLWRACLLTPTCYANCDDSTVAPLLNINDFICFTNRFAAGDTRANCDGSTSAPTLNVNDFTCFLNRYAAGCP